MKTNTDNHRVKKMIRKRRSIVAFSPAIPEKEKLDQMFEAARWAASSRNQQPWRFIYTTKENTITYNKFFDLLYEGNQEWAGSAPVLALSVAEAISDYKNKPNKYAHYDTGMAVGNMLLQATELGIYVHQMGGYDVEGARKAFAIPERFEPLAMMAIGYPGEIDNLPATLRRRELQKRTRKELNEFVFMNSWQGE